MRRRDFLIGTSMTLVFVDAATVMAAPVDPIAVALFTPRYPQSVQYANELALRGARVFSTDDDIVRLWRGPIRECLAAGATRIAGLTLHSHLDVLRVAGRELGLKVLNESLHTNAAGTLTSWVIGR